MKLSIAPFLVALTISIFPTPSSWGAPNSHARYCAEAALSLANSYERQGRTHLLENFRQFEEYLLALEEAYWWNATNRGSKSIKELAIDNNCSYLESAQLAQDFARHNAAEKLAEQHLIDFFGMKKEEILRRRNQFRPKRINSYRTQSLLPDLVRHFRTHPNYRTENIPRQMPVSLVLPSFLMFKNFDFENLEITAVLQLMASVPRLNIYEPSVIERILSLVGRNDEYAVFWHSHPTVERFREITWLSKSKCEHGSFLFEKACELLHIQYDGILVTQPLRKDLEKLQYKLTATSSPALRAQMRHLVWRLNGELVWLDELGSFARLSNVHSNDKIRLFSTEGPLIQFSALNKPHVYSSEGKTIPHEETIVTRSLLGVRLKSVELLDDEFHTVLAKFEF